MALIVWKSQFSVGVDSLDADHIVIISLINQMDEAKLSGSEEAAIGAILRTLIAYAVGHFRREEDLMRHSGYRALASHIEQHHLIEDQLHQLIQEYNSTADPLVSQEIMELLNYWIVEHILKCDMMYKPLLQSFKPPHQIII